MDDGVFRATVKYPNTHFLVVQVQIEGLSDADAKNIQWVLTLLMVGDQKVRDRNGNTYASIYSRSETSPTERSGKITFYFEVPDNIVVTDLMWKDRPPIPLEVK